MNILQYIDRTPLANSMIVFNDAIGRSTNNTGISVCNTGNATLMAQGITLYNTSLSIEQYGI